MLLNNNGIFNSMNWFIGVVEDINDPWKCGRVRVRIYGAHTMDSSIIPREDLPWAIPIMPITTAAISGIGDSPTGLVQGSTVIGFFLDGNNMQSPAVMGSLFNGYVLNNEQRNALYFQSEGTNPPGTTEFTNPLNGEPLQPSSVGNSNATGQQIISGIDKSINSDMAISDRVINGTFMQTCMRYSPTFDFARESSIYPTMQIGNITAEQMVYLRFFMACCESSYGSLREGSYAIRERNRGNYLGKYQFGADALTNIGYMRGKTVRDPSLWTGKDGVSSLDDFLSRPDVQEKAYLLYMNELYRQSKSWVGSLPANKQMGLLFASWLVGAGGAKQWYVNGINKVDGNNTSAMTYYTVGQYAYEKWRLDKQVSHEQTGINNLQDKKDQLQ